MLQKGKKGLDRMKMWFQLMYPSHVLKWFPPHFIVREVMLEQIDKWQKKGNRALLLYFDVKQYAEIRTIHSPETVQLFDESIMESFRQVLGEEIRDNDLLGVQRYNDDDFVIIVKENSEHLTYRMMDKWMDKVRERLEAAIHAKTSVFSDFPIRLHGASARIDPEQDIHEAFQAAMLEARGIAKIQLSADYGRIRNEIQRIIFDEDIRVLAQPIICFSSGEIMGWEMLTRGPEDSPYHQPLRLFELAEQAGMLIHLELLVIKKAFQEMVKKHTTMPIFINVTVPSLQNPFFYHHVMLLLQQYPQVKPENIILEITERHSIDQQESFEQAIELFRRSGFRFAVDDTGAGYASLNVIAQVLPDVIKVDRSIIQNIDGSEVKDSVLQALLLIAEKIGSEVVAEGIETEAEANVVMNKNVTFGQGYFFSRPQEPFPEVEENWVMKQRAK
ncbi:EAL domain-containing protein [Brevibacillus dissolubilis]|uniref:EAL domain-containing protein n=1 Tax=Brevibacillus dissolubilis TaxID=1844116 RepID=UPI00159BDF16|nr:EAL domain-containing protein [Brevibacillus dissolubilis]